MRLMKKSRWHSIFKPAFIIFLLISIFATVWLRSGVVSLEYKISNLEKRKNEIARDIKVIAAQKSSLLSVGRLESASSNQFVFPDRAKVVFVKRTDTSEMSKASLSAFSKNFSSEGR